MLTLPEQERLAYMAGQPVPLSLLQALDLQDEAKDLEEQVDELEARIDKLEARIDDLEGKIDGQLEDELEEAQGKLAEQKRTNNKLRRHLRDLAALLVSDGCKTVAGRKDAAGRIQRLLATGQA